VTASKLIDIPAGQWLNGITTIPRATTTLSGTAAVARAGGATNWPIVLIADSSAGCILRFDPSTKELATWYANSSMLPSPTAPHQIGINCLQYYDGHVYYSNAYAASLYRIGVDLVTLLPSMLSSSSKHKPKKTGITDPIQVVKPETLITMNREDFPYVDGFVVHRNIMEHIELFVVGENRVARVGKRRLRRSKWRWREPMAMDGFGILGGATCMAIGPEQVVKGQKKGRESGGVVVGGKDVVWIATGGKFCAGVKGYSEGGKVVRLDYYWNK
jgi:hypothetical protein